MGSWDFAPDMAVMKCKSSGGHSFQTIHISSKHAYKRHIIEMLTSPRNDLYRPKLCHLSCTLVTSTHPKYRIWGSFFRLAKPLRRKSKVSHGCWRLLFQTRSKSVQDKCSKVCVVLVMKKTRFGAVWRNPWGWFSRNFYASAHCGPTLIFQILSISVQVWGIMAEKPFRDTQSEQYSFLEPIIILQCYRSVARIAESMLGIVICLQITVRRVGQTVSWFGAPAYQSCTLTWSKERWAQIGCRFSAGSLHCVLSTNETQLMFFAHRLLNQENIIKLTVVTPWIYKKLSYRRGNARCVVSVEILPIATQQCSTARPEQIEVKKLEG